MGPETTALAKTEHQDTGNIVPITEWTRERIDLVKKTVCPSGISDAEFSLFIEICKRSGLDPLTKEIFCVPRRVNVGSKDSPRWIVKHEAQPAEAGLLARADRFADFGGIKAAAFYEGDDIEVTADGVIHKFNPAKRAGRLLGAWAQPFRNGRVYPVEILKLADYRQNTPQWNQKEETMIVKCARAAGLRRAYPNAFSGLYLREEMPAEEFDQTPAPKEEPRRLPARQATIEAKPETKPPPAETKPAPVTSFPKAAEVKGCDHQWDLKGFCSHCGETESKVAAPAKTPQPKEIRSRANRVWMRMSGAGRTLEQFQTWTTTVLGRAVPSAEWTKDDVDHLEAALPAELAPAEPGGAG